MADPEFVRINADPAAHRTPPASGARDLLSPPPSAVRSRFARRIACTSFRRKPLRAVGVLPRQSRLNLAQPAALTDASLNTLERYRYDAYGNVTFWAWSGAQRPQSTAGTKYLFTGQEYVPALGLHNYKNRMYASEIGRFLQSDPKLLDGGDLNLYRYCRNNPFNRTDPLGLKETKGANGVTDEDIFSAANSLAQQQANLAKTPVVTLGNLVNLGTVGEDAISNSTPSSRDDIDYSNMSASVYGAAWDMGHSNGADPWGAIMDAGRSTFGNRVFQQPLTTLGAAEVQATAFVGTLYAGVATAPAIATGVEAFSALPPQAKAFIIVGAIRLTVGGGGEHTATNLAARRVLSHTIAAETASAAARQPARGVGSP